MLDQNLKRSCIVLHDSLLELNVGPSITWKIVQNNSFSFYITEIAYFWKARLKSFLEPYHLTKLYLHLALSSITKLGTSQNYPILLRKPMI